MTYDAFISYSRRDSGTVDRIVQYLTGTGLLCFQDKNSIAGSDQWVEAITTGIENSRIILMFLSDNSMASDPARKEIHYAGESDKPIVPVLLSRNLTLPKSWRFHVARQNYIFADEPLEPKLPEIARAVNVLIDRDRSKAAYDDEESVLARKSYHRTLDPGNDRLGLPLGAFAEALASHQGNAYVLHSKPGKFYGHRLEALPLTSEFILEAQLTKTAGPDEECFGLEFGASFPGDYYQFLLNGAGTLRVARYLNKAWTDLIIASAQSRIHAARTPNLLKVVRKGEAIHMFLNGLHVASTDDFTVRTGLPGLTIARDIRVEFSRVTVRGIGLESVFREALDLWYKLETRAAKESLAYVERYDSTFRVSDWLDAGHLIREIQPDRKDSVLIVIGDHASALFNDGFHAQRIRHKINGTGKPDPFRWAAIVTDAALLRDERYLECPLISIGGPASNRITARLHEQVPRADVSRENIQVHHNIESGDRRMILWGPLASDTGEAVEYALVSDLLDRFLKMIWKD